jgi:NADH:ubiquinone oxidoreductase subunit C
LDSDTLVRQISAGFGKGLEPTVVKDAVVLELAPGLILDFARHAKEQLGFDLVTAITAVDNIDSFELLYHFVSVRPRSSRLIDPAFSGYLQARVSVPKTFGLESEQATPGPEGEPIVASITPVFPGANQQEREIYDLMGIRFRGHPNLQRILLWEGFPGHPLRKDWRPLNAEIPWHLAGMKGFGGEMLESPEASAMIADDGGGISRAVPVGATSLAPQRPPSRRPKPTEKMRLGIGQGGIVDDEGPQGPRSGYGAAPELGPAVAPPAGDEESS